MPQTHHQRSLRGQMTFIILLCWLLPMVLAAGALGGYLTLGLGRQSRRAIEEQFQLNLQMGADRVESAVEASRLPSYDPELREGWSQYQRDGNYALLYRRCYDLFNRLYQSDSRFRYAVVCLSGAPENSSITVVNGSSGLLSSQVRERWLGDLAAVADLAAGLDTAVGFLERDGQVYLVRNLIGPSACWRWRWTCPTTLRTCPCWPGPRRCRWSWGRIPPSPSKGRPRPHRGTKPWSTP